MVRLASLVRAAALVTTIGVAACGAPQEADEYEPEVATGRVATVRGAVDGYLKKRFFHSEGGNVYTSFVPIPAGQSTYQDNWRKQARNQPHEALVTLALAELGRCSEAKSMLVTFFAQQSAAGGYRYDTRFDRGAWDDRSYAAAPLLAFEAWEIYETCGGDDFLRTAYASLAKNKGWWDDHSGRRFPDEQGRACNGLWHWNDAIESIRDSLPEAGFPHVPTWEASDGPQNQCAADLNFYLVANYRALAKMEAKLGANDHFKEIADGLASTLRDSMWDPATSFFYGIDRRSGGKVMIKDIGGWMALYAGVATPAQAEAMVKTHLVPAGGAFHTAFGMPSLDKHHPKFGSNTHWSGGFWPGLSLLVVKGLVDYGYTEQARRIAQPFVSAVAAGAAAGRPLPEWYDSEHGSLGDLFCEVNDEHHRDNPKVNCDYITSALALPMDSIVRGSR